MNQSVTQKDSTGFLQRILQGLLQEFHGKFYKDSIEIQGDSEGFLKDAIGISIELILKITYIGLMVLDACSARAFSILKV